MNNGSKNYRLALGIAIVLILVTALVTGCGLKVPSLSNGKVTEITMSTGVDSNNRPVNPTTVFPVDTVGFYCSFKLSGFAVGSKLQAQWIYVGGDPVAEMETGKNYIAETQNATVTNKGSGYTFTVYSSGMPDYKWPKGDYKVVISVDGVEKGSTTFKVQ